MYVPNLMAVHQIVVKTTTNVNVMVALEENSEDHNNHLDSSFGEHGCVTKHESTDRQTDIAINRMMPLAWLIKNIPRIIDCSQHILTYNVLKLVIKAYK